jgi:hypothetical protein
MLRSSFSRPQRNTNMKVRRPPQEPSGLPVEALAARAGDLRLMPYTPERRGLVQELQVLVGRRHFKPH